MNILLIGSDGKPSETTFNSAKQLADSQGLDLIKVGEQNRVNIYKIMDMGKWKYEQKKKHKHKSAHIVTKEVRFKPRTDQHDQDTKIKHIKEFLEKGYNVKVAIFMKAREKMHQDICQEKMKQILQQLDGLYKMVNDSGVQSSPSSIVADIQPLKHGTTTKKQQQTTTDQ